MIEYYKILGINETAPMQKIIDAYTRLAIKNNPNNGGSDYLFKIIHYAYNEIITNYGNENNKEILLLEPYDIKENILDGELEYLLYIPTPEEICNDIHKAFYVYNTNPFIKDNNYNLKSVIEYYNSLQLKKKDNIRFPLLEYKKIADRISILGDNPCSIKRDLLTSNVGPGINICLLICQLCNYEVYNHQAKNKIKILLIKEASKDIISKNGGMILNEEKIFGNGNNSNNNFNL